MRNVSLTTRLRAAAMAVVLTGGAIGVVSVAGGCSKSSDNGPPDTGHFAVAFAQSFCSALSSCCNAANYKYDEGSCVAQVQAQFQSVIDVVKNGKVIYDPNAVAACEAAFHDREAKCTADGGPPPSADAGFLDPIQAACWPMLKGTVAPGQECSASTECKTPGPNVIASCLLDTNRPGADPTKKVCFVTTLHVLPGGACRSQPTTGGYGFESAQCEPTLGICQTDANSTDRFSGTCAAYVGVGDDCGGATPSGNSVVCNPATSYCDFLNTRKCVALPVAGEPCVSNGSTPQCMNGLYCDTSGGPPGPGTCSTPKPDGAACTVPNQCMSSYCAQSPSTDSGLFVGTCTSIVHEEYDVSPRSCGFGPRGTGAEDAGIQPPATGSSFGGKLWFEVTR